MDLFLIIYLDLPNYLFKTSNHWFPNDCSSYSDISDNFAIAPNRNFDPN